MLWRRFDSMSSGKMYGGAYGVRNEVVSQSVHEYLGREVVYLCPPVTSHDNSQSAKIQDAKYPLSH